MTARSHYRASERRAVRIAAVVVDDVGGRRLDGWIVDLGLGGARLLTATAVAPGTSLRVQVEAPNLWDPLVIPAEALWSQTTEPEAPGGPAEHLTGVRFHLTTPASVISLIELMGSDDYE